MPFVQFFPSKRISTYSPNSAVSVVEIDADRIYIGIFIEQNGHIFVVDVCKINKAVRSLNSHDRRRATYTDGIAGYKMAYKISQDNAIRQHTDTRTYLRVSIYLNKGDEHERTSFGSPTKAECRYSR